MKPTSSSARPYFSASTGPSISWRMSSKCSRRADAHEVDAGPGDSAHRGVDGKGKGVVDRVEVLAEEEGRAPRQPLAVSRVVLDLVRDRNCICSFVAHEAEVLGVFVSLGLEGGRGQGLVGAEHLFGLAATGVEHAVQTVGVGKCVRRSRSMAMWLTCMLAPPAM